MRLKRLLGRIVACTVSKGMGGCWMDIVVKEMDVGKEVKEK